MALFAWTTLSGIGQDVTFSVSLLAVGFALGSLGVAVVSYFFVPERFASLSTFAAYMLLLCSVGLLTVQTGHTNSPFLALWMIVSVFSGIFGIAVSVGLIVALTVFTGWAAASETLNTSLVIGIILTGYLPLIFSYLLWHGKSGTERGKDKAYYDLANELDQVSNKAEVVINAINDGVIAVNGQGDIELINPAAQRIVGWGHQDALNLDYKAVLQMVTRDGKMVDISTDPVYEVLSTNQPVKRNNLQIETSSGKKMNAEIVVSPIGRAGSGAIIVFSDVTKEKAEENAQAEFISTASHEMRTPVASIEGYLGLALNPNTATIDEKARGFIQKAHDSAQHLGRLFQDLLDVTKAEDGRLKNKPKVIEAVMFTSEIVEGLKPKAEEKGLRLFFKPSVDDEGGTKNIKPIFYVNLDPDHLREVLANLVENAIKYTPKGEVVIDVRGDDDHVLITITDSGIGIPSEDIPHLFQKFYRVDNSDTREIGGTGLGLYLCRRLTEAMDGRIWVESEYKKGSTFSVELPRISHEEANHLIEVGTAQVTHPAEQEYLDERSVANPAAKANHSNAPTTPIIMNKQKPLANSSASSPDSAAQPADEKHQQDAPDPIISASAEKPVEEKAPAQAGTALPPTLSDIESSLQKNKTIHHAVETSIPAPTPAPESAPAPAAETRPIQQVTAQQHEVPIAEQPVPMPTAERAPAAPAASAASTRPSSPPERLPARSTEIPLPVPSVPVREEYDHLALEVPERE